MSKERIYKYAIAVLSALLAASIAVGIFAYLSGEKTKKNYALYRATVGEAGKTAQSDSVSELRRRLSVAENAVETLEKQLSEANNPENESELRALLEKKLVEIDLLKSDLRATGKGITVNLSEQEEIISDIRKKIESAPENTYKKTVRTEQGVPVTDESGEVIYDTVVTKPLIALAYSDDSASLTYRENSTLKFTADSFRMPALALGLLKTALSVEKITSVSGSDSIKIDFGETIGDKTVAELLCEMLMNRDKNAWDILAEKYPDITSSTLVSCGFEIGEEGITGDADAALRLIRELGEVASGVSLPICAQVREALIGSANSVIPVAAFQPASMHFFIDGNDTYAEIMYVEDAHPFALAVLTDMAGGGDTVNECLADICRSINEMNGNFYKTDS